MPDKRTVVVTGGSRGIGRSICLSLANPDTQIYFNYFSPSNPEAEKAAAAETEKIVAELGSSANSMSVDVADTKEVEAFFEKIVDETGRIDILVNNAGITKDGLLVRMNENDWNMVLNINLKGAFTCTRLAAKIMMKQRYGRIVNIASVVGVSGNPGQANYSASKAGLIGLTKTAAKELAARNVTVNAVAPGFIETDMTAALSEKARRAMLDQVPMGRGGQPEDVAAAVKFLASDDAAYITGHVIHVNGGMYM
ncbi:MAG: 3-oxoacyl-[acyl-carrier-protein] reductase [Proteobacteria bacterium]|nr:3-oxoacyl-[acyl-carrier-protein] reductase [Pseudomonadota bacterium]MBU4259615.1 3-oxoacyl-[acyl-carrier-protein] reductase [Pseudomonadota bacterium]MBU4287792.1 3-oxoacyl-[acyl-carrier-protein] reductase [Pseudomonadota bacterium]MBU4414234.1 3-oxoacyl-[acyl-carrier-protein] reductase [Pseudomonadota bacterium]MCG2758762.1 3-oxoacyl-[acyl-carrier-protein] reductase [Desulfobacteraceae bacterium]